MDNQEELDDRFLSLFKAASFIARYKEGVITPEEEKTLQQWLGTSTKNQEWFNELTSIEDPNEHLVAVKEFQKSSKEEFIRTFKGAGLSSRVRRRNRITTIGALAVLVISGTIYYTVYRNHPSVLSSDQHTAVALTDLPPGGNRAMLKLADGRVITLDSAQNGELSKQGNTVVNKTGSGMLAYEVQNNKSAVIGDNILSTPVGGRYMVVLPDGTKVWLNSSSSLRYPTAFVGRKREVTLTGEAYFEIVHDNAMPFYVKVNNAILEDVGTHFDVMAYDDEPAFRTSLFEGAVKVSKDKYSGLLQPGQQVSIDGLGNYSLSKANAASVLSWKNQEFYFDQDNIETIMRQIARWYGVSVSYDTRMPGMTFTGEITRNIGLSEVLKMMQSEGVQFRMEGKTITVVSK